MPVGAKWRKSNGATNKGTLLAMEIFDVVDENDEVIGQRTRADVHALGLRHRSIHLLVFNTAGELFLQKRSLTKDENPGEWDSSVSGHVDSGESYADCVLRETAEEIGHRIVDEPEFLFKFDAEEKTGMEFCKVYSTTAEGPFTLDPVEITEGRWYSPQEIDDAISAGNPVLTASLKAIWARLHTSAQV